jgi:hypothetical protein
MVRGSQVAKSGERRETRFVSAALEKVSGADCKMKTRTYGNNKKVSVSATRFQVARNIRAGHFGFAALRSG